MSGNCYQVNIPTVNEDNSICDEFTFSRCIYLNEGSTKTLEDYIKERNKEIAALKKQSYLLSERVRDLETIINTLRKGNEKV